MGERLPSARHGSAFAGEYLRFRSISPREGSKLMDGIAERANAWIVSQDTGASSKALWAAMMGSKSYGSHPHDSSDIGRCFRLLDAIPEWRERLPEMAKVSPYWAALVGDWQALEQLHRSGDHSALYRRMRHVLDPIEKVDSCVIRLGNGVTMRFGS